MWLVPAILSLVLVSHYAVDIPYIDQWDGELPFLMKVAAGEARASDLIALHMEHRIAFCRISSLAVAAIGGWRTNGCLCASWLVTCGAAWSLVVLHRDHQACKAWYRGLFSFTTGSLLFSVQAYDTWFNPVIGSQWVFVELILVLALVTLRNLSHQVLFFPISLMCATVATFSSSNGMLLWLVLFPVMAVQVRGPQRRGMFLVWAAAAAIAITGYFWGFRKPPESPSLLAGLGDPLAVAGFFLANVGAPLAFGIFVSPLVQARIVGMTIVVIVTLCCLVHVKRWSNAAFVRAAMPWYSIIAYAMATQLAISLGRAGSGAEVALAARYMPTANLSICAIVALVPIVLDELTLERRADASRFAWLTDRRAKVIKASLFAALLAAQVIGAIATLPTYANEHTRLTAAKAAVLFSRCFKDPELLSNVWSYKTLVDIDEKLDFMDSHGYLRPKTFRSCKIADLPKAGQSRSSGTNFRGAIEQTGRVNEQAVGFTGWAIDPQRGRPADAVLLSWEDDAFDATVFAIVPVGVPRPDVTAKLSDSRFLRAGWGRLFPVSAMPKRPCQIRAWAFNTDDGTIAELDGVVEWRPEG